MAQKCDVCDGDGLSSAIEPETFLYGQGADAVKLSAYVRVYRCSLCGGAYVDGEAEVLRDLAVTLHKASLAVKG